jgi:CRISPR-associated RAMP protein (TIGR02581 family)
MERPLHIGKGASLEPIGTDLPVIKDALGIPYIPGSSLKGVFRAFAERLLRTLNEMNYKQDGKQIWACNPLDDKEKCIPPKRNMNPPRKSLEELEVEAKNGSDKIDDKKLTKLILDNSCTACSIFGSGVVASRIYFKDAYLTNKDDLLHLSEIRDGVAIDRDTGTAKSGAKFDYEIVSSGAKFGIEIILENVEEWEAGFIFALLRSWERGELALGGKSTSGLGWNKLEGIKTEMVNGSNLLDYVINGSKNPVDTKTLVDKFQNGLKREGQDA